jgi:hypothetical protein
MAYQDSKSEFCRILRQRFVASKRSYTEVAAASDLDVAYVYRLVNGVQSHPTRDVVIRLGFAGLRLAIEEVDELLLAAECAPLVR